MDMQPINFDEIPTDSPLPWPIFDQDGNIMFYDGEEVTSRQLQLLGSVLEGSLFQGKNAATCPRVTRGQVAEPPRRQSIAKTGIPSPTSESLSSADTLNTPFPPPGIKPQVGERLQLRLLDQDKQTHLYSRLVGYIKGYSIIITPPMERGMPANVLNGESLEARMLIGNDIFMFRSTVLQSRATPARYLHLEYPTKVTRHMLRRHPWAKVDIDTQINNQGFLSSGKLSNLSSTGALLSLPHSIGSEGDSLHLDFCVSIDELYAPLSLIGVIRNITEKEIQQQRLMEYGVEFRDISPNTALWLRCLVFERIAKGFCA